jgi:hypothetical protein
MAHDEYPTDPTVQLADCLEARGLRTQMVERLTGPKRMTVSNPAHGRLTETIIFHEGAFYWPWRDQIGTDADVPRAAEIIARVLATADEIA